MSIFKLVLIKIRNQFFGLLIIGGFKHSNIIRNTPSVPIQFSGIIQIMDRLNDELFLSPVIQKR